MAACELLAAALSGLQTAPFSLENTKGLKKWTGYV